MGKAARRKHERASLDIHSQIATEAARARAKPAGIATEGYPALQELLQAARAAVLQSAPREIQFEGRTYWCRVSHGMSLIELFDSPATAVPLVRTVCGSTDLHGHNPAH